MAEPYTIHIYVVDGDPEGVKIIVRQNWTGWGIAFPRSSWPAITHYAPVERIELWGDSSKYRVVFAEPAKEISHIPLGNAAPGSFQGPRYTSLEKLLNSESVAELLAKK